MLMTFWRAFVDGLIENDEKVVFFFLKKHTEFKIKVQKPYPTSETNFPKSIPYFWPKRLKTIPFGATHIAYTYVAHLEKIPTPGFEKGVDILAACR